MQFQKQLQLVGEAHEQEIAELQQKHAAELWAVQEETKRLREQIVFLEAVLPKEYKGRVDLPGDTRIDTSSVPLPKQEECKGRVDLPGDTKIDTSSVPLRKHRPVQLWFHSSSHQSLDSSRLGSNQLGSFQLGSISTTDIQLETTESGARRNSANGEEIEDDQIPAERDNVNELMPTHSNSIQDGSLVLGTSSHDTDDWNDEHYVHSTERALSNWCAIGKLILMANSRGASRLHPIWHKSVSRLKCSLDAKASVRQSSHFRATQVSHVDMFSGIVEDAGMRKEEDLNRFVRLSRLNSIVEPKPPREFWCKKRMTLAPTSKKRIFWDSCSALWCANDFIMFPLQFVDSLDFGDFENTRTWVATIFWTIDIFVSMSTGYYTEDGAVEMRRCMIIRNYTKSWMVFDVLVLTPDWISILLNSGGFRMGLGILKFTRVLRMVRLMRAVRLLPKLWESIGQHNSERVVTLARLLQHIILMILINHYVACFLLATWLEIESQDKFLHTYFRCLHWALAHSTLGNMDIFPTNLFERLWTCLMLMLSMILFSYFLSNITNAVMHLGSLTGERRKQETRMRQFFNENKVSRKLAGQVWNYVWRYHDLESRTRLNEVKLFTVLPNRMRVELYWQIFLPYLLVHPLFSWYNQMEPEALVMLCSLGIEQLYLHPSEELPLEPNNTIRKMFFINSGTLLYQPFMTSSADAIVVPCHMWVCEEALWSLNAKIMGTISAGQGGSDLMLVLPEEFRGMASRYSKSMPFLVSYAQTFIARFNAACADDDYEDLLFNSSDLIEGFIHIAKVDYGHRFSTNTKRNIITKAFNLPRPTNAIDKIGGSFGLSRMLPRARSSQSSARSSQRSG